MVVHFRETQIFEWKVTQAGHGTVDIYLTPAHLFEKNSELILVHVARISDLKYAVLSGTGISKNPTKVPAIHYCCFGAFGLLLGAPGSLNTWNIMNLDIGGKPKEFVFSTERRGRSRFPLREEVRYRVLHSRGSQTYGVGRTLNIGSGGILFTTEEDLPVGRMLEISVNWPARLDGTCPLKFVATGRVVRAENHQAAVRIERYEFRTRGAAMTSAG